MAPRVQVAPVGDEVTMYEVITEPPLSDGASKVTVMLLPEVTAATFAGAEGVVEGVAGLLAEDCCEFPTVVIASTLKVYVEPLFKPVTTQVVWPDVGSQVPASFPCESYAVTMYSSPVRVPEPKCVGALHATLTCPFAAVTPVIEGAKGSVPTTGDVKEAKEFPIKFLAVTRNSYELPAFKPVIIAEVFVDTPSVNVVHVPDVATRYSTM